MIHEERIKEYKNRLNGLKTLEEYNGEIKEKIRQKEIIESKVFVPDCNVHEM